jgi:hypothetical protein
MADPRDPGGAAFNRLIDDRHHPDHPDSARRLAETLGKIIDDQINKVVSKRGGPKFGFALLIFSFGEGGTMGYMSNARREDMILALREQADYLEGKRRP